MDIRVQTIIELINRQPSRDFSLEELAAAVGLSACYLDRLFSQGVGVPCKKYMSTCRLEAAADLLLREAFLDVSKISRRVNLKDPNYFCRCFKKHFGITPKEYRRQHHQKMRVAQANDKIVQ